MVYEIKLFLAALVVALCAAVVFRPAFRDMLTSPQYRSVWGVMGVALVATFFGTVPMIYFLGVVATALFASKTFGGDIKAKIAAFMLLSITFPPVSSSLGGVGDINQLFVLDHTKAMALVLLGPAGFQLAMRKRGDSGNPFRAVDIFLVLYKLLSLVLLLKSITYTAIVRFLFENTIEIFLPYYVMTRGLKSADDIRFVMTRLMVGFVFIASVGVAEEAAQRSFYAPLQYIYGMTWQLTHVLLRGGLLRVQATAPQPIALAFFLVIALGTWTWLIGGAWKSVRSLAVYAVLLGALAFTWSRGPWLGAAIVIVNMLVMSRLSWRAYAGGLAVAVVLAVVAKSTGADALAYDFLKALFGSGEEDYGTIEYRRQILEASLALLKQSPWFGVPNYWVYLQDFRQGEGIIDLVNTYVLIAMDTGVVGVALYAAPQVIAVVRMVHRLESPAGGRPNDLFVMAFVSTLLAVAFILFTASTIGTMSYTITFLVAAALVYAHARAPSRQASKVAPMQPVANFPRSA